MNFPNIPDNFNKILLIIGIGLLIFFHLENEKYISEYRAFMDSSNNAIENEDIKLSKISNELKFLQDDLKYIFTKHNIQIPLIDSSNHEISFNTQLLKDTRLKSSIIDSISLIVRNYQLKYNELEYYKKSLKNIENKLVRYNNFEDKLNTNMIATLGAVTIILIALFNLFKENLLKIKKEENELNNSPKYYDCCQSCGKKFNSIITKGTNKDFSLNNAFCNNCFVEGEFTSKYNNISDVICEIELYDMSKFSKKLIIVKAKNLERWKATPY